MPPLGFREENNDRNATLVKPMKKDQTVNFQSESHLGPRSMSANKLATSEDIEKAISKR